MKSLAAWILGLSVYVLKLTCRHRRFDDPRANLKNRGYSYIYGQLHAHQVSTGMFGERGTIAMVSRSGDGEMIVPLLRLLGKELARGSSGNQKGGSSALQQMIRRVKQGRPGVIAVDGPRGPRGSVQKGIGLLAKKSGMPVLPVLAVPNRRWILKKAWDRLQIPKPFARIDFYFGEPIFVDDQTDLALFADRLAGVLEALELEHDPNERQQPVAQSGRRRVAERLAA